MIRLVQGRQRHLHPREIDEMHRLRARVFHERLQWDVNVRDGWEIDEFDECDPLYLIAVDEQEKVRGSLRLLPTTGPNMLRDVFKVLLPEDQTVESALVWESSRFTVDHDAAGERSPNRLNRFTAELLLGIVEVGMMAGISDVVSVYDLYFARILKRADCQAEAIGTPQRIGRVTAFAGLFEISDRMLGNLRAASGIEGSVLEPASMAQLRAAA